jgi:hypothetical protein
VENDISIWEVGKPTVGLINGILILLKNPGKDTSRMP